MTHRSRLDNAREIASIRKLKLQRAWVDVARTRASVDSARDRETRAIAARDAHFNAWRDAAHPTNGLLPALLINFAGALVAITSEHDEARELLHRQQAECDACQSRMMQSDRLMQIADEHALVAEKQYLRALDECRMAELETRFTLSMENW